jgi:hypothetical protein
MVSIVNLAANRIGVIVKLSVTLSGEGAGRAKRASRHLVPFCGVLDCVPAVDFAPPAWTHCAVISLVDEMFRMSSSSAEGISRFWRGLSARSPENPANSPGERQRSGNSAGSCIVVV